MKNKKLIKRITALILTVVMIVGFIPSAIFAEQEQATNLKATPYVEGLENYAKEKPVFIYQLNNGQDVTSTADPAAKNVTDGNRGSYAYGSTGNLVILIK